MCSKLVVVAGERQPLSLLTRSSDCCVPRFCLLARICSLDRPPVRDLDALLSMHNVALTQVLLALILALLAFTKESCRFGRDVRLSSVWESASSRYDLSGGRRPLTVTAKPTGGSARAAPDPLDARSFLPRSEIRGWHKEALG
jgi:hypothetical protein